MRADIEYDPFNLIDWDEHFGISKLLPSMGESAKMMFMPLSAQIDEYIKIENEKNPRFLRSAKNFIDFLEWIKVNYSDEKYAIIQKQFLARDYINSIFSKEYLTGKIISPFEKYLAFPIWARSKFSAATKLLSNQERSLDIVDLGSGPGHFGVVCKYLGHNFDGVDQALPAPWEGADKSLFSSLCDFFGILVTDRRITPMESLNLNKRYDILTIQMGNFSRINGYDKSAIDPETGQYKKISRLWSTDEWLFFIRDIIDNVMKEEFNIDISMGPNMSQEAVRAMSNISKSSLPEKYIFSLDQTADFSKWNS